MLKTSRRAPMSNTERQRLFRERNPGYYGRLHRKRNAGIKQMLKQQRIAIQAKAQAEYQALKKAALQAEAKFAIVNQLPPISRMLPAPPPVDPLMMEIAALAEKRKAEATVHVRGV